jgi:hypothetical protein
LPSRQQSKLELTAHLHLPPLPQLPPHLLLLHLHLQPQLLVVWILLSFPSLVTHLA